VRAQSHANPSTLLESEVVAKSSVDVQALPLWVIEVGLLGAKPEVPASAHPSSGISNSRG
jgi:hypothetical protein